VLANSDTTARIADSSTEVRPSAFGTISILLSKSPMDGSSSAA
jgi:hypothetical protein